MFSEVENMPEDECHQCLQKDWRLEFDEVVVNGERYRTYTCFGYQYDRDGGRDVCLNERRVKV